MTKEMKLIYKVTTVTDMEGNPVGGIDRESYALHIPEKGFVEAWRTKSPKGYERTESGYSGGIGLHFLSSPGEWACHVKSCWLTGGECWADGSSLAFESIEHHFDDPDYIKSVLMEWARGNFEMDKGEKE